ncbi:hypothetical protein TNCV_597971 [Trichonephila clavipes]|nr:hypothetical protein TNCV_597971 [Trichonephila clavipes]
MGKHHAKWHTYRDHHIEEFLENEDIHRNPSPDGLSSQIYRSNLGRTFQRGSLGEGHCNPQHLSENNKYTHIEGPKKRIVELVGLIAAEAYVFLYFQYEVTVRCLCICKREPYLILTNLFYFALSLSYISDSDGL